MADMNNTFDANYFLNLFYQPTEKEEDEEEKKIKQQENIADLLQEEEVETVDNIGVKEQLDIEDTYAPVIPQDVSKQPTPSVQFDAEYFLNQFRAGQQIKPDYPDEIDEPTAAQRFELGTRLERNTLGNLLRTVKAGAMTFANNKSLQDNIVELEEERKARIFAEMQDKYGTDFTRYEDDIVTTSGKIATAIADPVTFFIPWAKVAKLGKLGATATGAAIGASDMALYEYAAYGEVSPSNVFFGAATGGVSSLTGKILSNKFAAPKDPNINLGKVDNITEDTIVQTSVKAEPNIVLNNKEIDDLDNVVKLITSENQPILKELEGSTVLLDMYRKAQNDIKLHMDAVEELSKKVNVQKGQLELPNIKKLDEKNKAIISPQKLASLAKKRKEAEDFLQDEFLDLYTKYSRGQVELTEGTLKKFATVEDYQLTDSVLQKVLYEAYRPVVGAGIGFTAGTFLGDEDDTINYSLMGAGMFSGLLYNRIKAAPYLTKESKEKAFGIINGENARMLHNFLKVKISGTTAARGLAHGGPLEVLNRNLFHIQDGKYRNIIGAEQAADLIENTLLRRAYDVVQNATERQRIAAGLLKTQIKTRQQLKKELNLSTEDMVNVDNIIKNINIFTKDMNKYVRGGGISFEEIPNWNLPQIYNLNMIHQDKDFAIKLLRKAIRKQDPKLAAKDVRILADEIHLNITDYGRLSMFEGRNFDQGKLGKFAGIPQLKNYQKERYFTNPEARKILAPILENDVEKILEVWIGNTVKGVEFARKVGPKGEMINKLVGELKRQRSSGAITEREYKEKIKLMGRTVDAYFGVLHKSPNDILQSNTGKDIFAVFTFLSNTTMLPRSAIPTIGDLVQPFQNSNVFSAVKGFAKAWKKDSISAKYGIGGVAKGSTDKTSTITKDLEGFYSGVHPSTRLQSKLGDLTKVFFKYNLMSPITNLAAKVAFNTGVDEVFEIAKKVGTKNAISKSTRTKLNFLGASKNEVQYLNKFKSVEDALQDETAERILVRAGQKTFNRDVGLPGVGNRLLFSQSNNPLVRSLGLFLSWAQYKTTQMNGLISRVEDGDVKLAIKMLGTLGIFGGLRELQIEFSPAKEYYEKHEPKNFSPRWWSEAAGLAGILDWRADKIARIMGTYSGNGYQTAFGSISPLFGEVEKLYTGAGKTYRNFAAEDYEGALVSTLKTLPIGSELVEYSNMANEALTGDKLLQDVPNIQPRERKLLEGYATGGIVTGPDVPFTKENPADRVDPFTGQPYQEQMSRLGFGNE